MVVSQVRGLASLFPGSLSAGRILLVLFALLRRRAILDPLGHQGRDKRALYRNANLLAYLTGFGGAFAASVAAYWPTPQGINS